MSVEMVQSIANSFSPEMLVHSSLEFEEFDFADEIHEPFGDFAKEILKELAADAILIALHYPDRKTRFINEPKSCFENPIIEQEMFDAAQASLSAENIETKLFWVAPEQTGTSRELLTIKFFAHKTLVTITALFWRIQSHDRIRANTAAVHLMPTADAFFKILDLQMNEHVRQEAFMAAINNSETGTILVDADGHIILVNDAAERLIIADNGLWLSNNRLACANFSETLRIQAAIEHVFAIGKRPQFEGNHCSPVVTINRKLKRPLIATVSGSNFPTIKNAGTVAVINLIDPQSDIDFLIMPVCELYALSPVESRLACRLANGCTLQDAAKELRVKIQTARSYLKQVFLKTDTNRQAELVCLLLKSSVRTTWPCHSKPF